MTLGDLLVTVVVFFDNLERLGGIVVPFITSRNMIRKYRLNYHLHRKIVVIDGQIGWTGGFNVGDQYLGRKKKNLVTGVTRMSES